MRIRLRGLNDDGSQKEKIRLYKMGALGLAFLLIVVLSVPLGMVTQQSWKRIKAFSTIEKKSRLAPHLIKLASAQTRHRGLVIAYLDSQINSRTLQVSLREATREIETLVQTVTDLMDQNPFPDMVNKFSQWKGQMAMFGQYLERIEQRDVSTGEWLEFATHLMLAHEHLVQALYHPETVDESIEYLAILVEEAIAIVNYSGLERALLGHAIASNTRPGLEDLAKFEHYRGLTDGYARTLSESRSITTLPPNVIEALEQFHTTFAIQFDHLRASVYRSIIDQKPYTIEPEEWWALSSRSIATAREVAINANIGMGILLNSIQTESLELFTISIVSSISGIVLVLLLTIWLLSSLLKQIKLLTESQAVLETHKQTLEEAVKDRIAESNAIFETAVDGIITIDNKGIILTANPAISAIFGYSSNDLIGRDMAVLMPEPHRSRHFQYIQNYLDKGEERIIGSEREVTALRKGGEEFPVRIAIGHAKLGKEDRFVGFIQEITQAKTRELELKTAKLAAEQADKIKTAFLANMSHEIRTPMNAVLGFLKVSLENNNLPLEVTKHLNTAYKSAESLLSIITDILDISKLESGRFDIVQVCMNLPHILKETLEMFKQSAAAKGIELSFDLDDSLTHCYKGDPARIKQVLVNLVGNAVKFTDRGFVKVEVKPGQEEGLYFCVSDSGIGISPNNLEIVFNSFVQVDESSTRAHRGTGLGTSISKRLVELMGGKLWAESIEGIGSKFQFTIRAEKAPCTDHCIANGLTEEPPETSLANGFDILVAEDIIQNAKLAELRLKKQGHRVTIARDGKEAISKYTDGSFDVILMDVHMPNMDGIEAARHIRKMEADNVSHTPIIALTASVMDDELQQCLDVGMDEIAPKPVNFERLFQLLETVTSENRMRQTTKAPLTASDMDRNLFSSLSGLVDVESGLKRWGENSDRFLLSLKGFTEDLAVNMQLLKTDFAAKNYQNISEVCHKIKGVAANLAIKKIPGIAEAIGLHLKELSGSDSTQDRPEKISELIDELIREAKALLEAVPIDRMNHPVPETNQVDPAEVLKQLDALVGMLQRNEMDDERINQFIGAVTNLVPSNVVNRLSSEIDRFDFDNVLVTMAEIRKQIDL